ncbi:unnamed protein product [Medioppia subpectinata]|uniref:Cytochrome P450 n=1 Tax=Medioppia subpectinata TaxID=1979941 RepID=A0A7R9KH19_9ACAR|nr:unnamed protein product [Medioppia subpectinata]CAG2103265.1 unnamed protein product [Medioppia subpectinata]
MQMTMVPENAFGNQPRLKELYIESGEQSIGSHAFSGLSEYIWIITNFGVVNSLYYAGHRPVLTFAEPELLKNIMIRDFNSFTDRNFELLIDPVLNRNVAQASGDDWKRLRQIISPAFSSGRMKRMYPSIRECLRDFTAHLDAYARDGRPMNAKEMFGNFTMDVVATCAFATKTNIHNDPNNPVDKYAKSLLDFNPWKIIAMLALPPKWLQFLSATCFIINMTTTVKPEGLQYFNDLMSKIITTRKEMPDSSAKYSDFLQLLMDARNDRVAARDDYNTTEANYVNTGLAMM